MNNKVFLHCDVNNFYASVAMVLDANLKDKPVAVVKYIDSELSY